MDVSFKEVAKKKFLLSNDRWEKIRLKADYMSEQRFL